MSKFLTTGSLFLSTSSYMYSLLDKICVFEVPACSGFNQLPISANFDDHHEKLLFF